MLGIPNIYKAISRVDRTTLPNSLVVASSLTKVGRWHLPCNTVSFVSKIRASSNTPLWPRGWDSWSTYDGMVVASSHLYHSRWPHHLTPYTSSPSFRPNAFRRIYKRANQKDGWMENVIGWSCSLWHTNATVSAKRNECTTTNSLS